MRNGGNVWCSACYCKQCICDLHRKEAEEHKARRSKREAYYAKHDWTSPEFAAQGSLPMNLDVPRLN